MVDEIMTKMVEELLIKASIVVGIILFAWMVIRQYRKKKIAFVIIAYRVVGVYVNGERTGTIRGCTNRSHIKTTWRYTPNGRVAGDPFESLSVLKEKLEDELT